MAGTIERAPERAWVPAGYLSADELEGYAAGGESAACADALSLLRTDWKKHAPKNSLPYPYYWDCVETVHELPVEGFDQGLPLCLCTRCSAVHNGDDYDQPYSMLTVNREAFDERVGGPRSCSATCLTAAWPAATCESRGLQPMKGTCRPPSAAGRRPARHGPTRGFLHGGRRSQ